jgi:hypothetical protein
VEAEDLARFPGIQRQINAANEKLGEAVRKPNWTKIVNCFVTSQPARPYLERPCSRDAGWPPYGSSPPSSCNTPSPPESSRDWADRRARAWLPTQTTRPERSGNGPSPCFDGNSPSGTSKGLIRVPIPASFGWTRPTPLGWSLICGSRHMQP